MAKKASISSIVSTGNKEIDKIIGGGIPSRTLNLIEGENDTGKSVLSQQFNWGALRQNHNVAYYTSENTISSFLSQTTSLSLDMVDHFIWGYLKIYPLQIEDIEWSQKEMKRILDLISTHISKNKEDVIMIDSLTVFTTYSTEDDIMDFLADCRFICDSGKTMFVTLHKYAYEEDTLVRIRSIFDGHLVLRKEQIGDRYINILEVAKVRGANKTTGNIVSFEVHPGFGLRVIPITQAQI
ncbi:MAG: flagellar accessory protein FlaH [Candidatus Methanoliparum thermophilum]|uniref:Flagellar accessory protein FlaH n=1 Tax=Methanoliparum thermophilum TaxID=2491083 RepID=A0A520KR19_METT2|nr:ATPase domain-containing protein [Candidatus Methanoliparum sp. LAM-1]RZN64066.1 MAG: flagellar accessory protein FlaH [Candidatus Methanoliparum thermophilum]BDC35678.1 flagellar accessory protein FlaH [Candidatus Methanoliparum sp. LAM-1]